MYALSDATVRRLVILAREAESGLELVSPDIDLSELDARAIHFARLVEDPGGDGIRVLEIAVRLVDHRGTRHVSIHLDDARFVDVLVPVSFLLDDLALHELGAWPAPHDVVPA